jgi:prevent-host-death family protein
MRMGLREANQHFSKAIKAVRAGREVVLTERGKPIAVIKPLTAPDAVAEAVQRMMAEGLLIPAKKAGPIRWGRWKPVRIKGAPLTKTLREDRDAR